MQANNRRTIMWQLVIAAIFIVSAVWVQAQPTPANEYRLLPQHELLYLSTDDGTAVIELAPWLAPIHVARFKQLAQNNHFKGASFYRVIEGFVAQAGLDALPNAKELANRYSRLPLEATIPAIDGFKALNNSPQFAAVEGVYKGFNLSGDDTGGQFWANHCYGVVAAARETAANTATTEFYIMIGPQARHLDYNMSVFGRVVWGMPVIQRVNRGVLGQDPQFTPTKITGFSLGSELPTTQQKTLYMRKTDTEHYAQQMQERLKFASPFFHQQPAAVANPCKYMQATEG